MNYKEVHRDKNDIFRLSFGLFKTKVTAVAYFLKNFMSERGELLYI